MPGIHGVSHNEKFLIGLWLCSVTRSKKNCLLKYEKNKVNLLKYVMFGIILGYNYGMIFPKQE